MLHFSDVPIHWTNVVSARVYPVPHFADSKFPAYNPTYMPGILIVKKNTILVKKKINLAFSLPHKSAFADI